MATKVKVRIGLMFHTVNDHDYIHFRAYPVVIGPTAWDQTYAAQRGESHGVPWDRIRNVNEKVNGLYLDNLTIQSQGDTDGTRRLYGWDVEYRDVFGVDLYKAQAMARTLKIIADRMQKTSDKFGWPATFAQYCASVAAAIGADAFVFKRSGSGSSYSENDYDIKAIKEGVYKVDHLVKQYENGEVVSC